MADPANGQGTEYIFRKRVGVGTCLTLRYTEIGEEEAYRRAMQGGWTPPKWWEVWRWGEGSQEIVLHFTGSN